MSNMIKQLRDNKVVGILFMIFIAYALYMLYNNLASKNKYADEYMSGNNEKAYKNGSNAVSGPKPAEAEGSNEVFASVNGSSSQEMPSACNKLSNQNPADLLPKDNNSQWAQLNPAGKGDLANINLLKAGYHIGIDTVGQTLRNANLQVRSEPANPQVNVGPWNLSTIEGDNTRPSLEIGQGPE
jgi:hypothetical protein